MSTVRVVPDRPNLTDLVAEEVRAWMGRRQMTQTQLAEILGLPQSALSARVRGRIAFRIDELEKAADALGIHPAVLLSGRGDAPQPPQTHATTDRFPGRVVTLGEVIAMHELPAQSVAAAA